MVFSFWWKIQRIAKRNRRWCRIGSPINLWSTWWFSKAGSHVVQGSEAPHAGQQKNSRWSHVQRKGTGPIDFKIMGMIFLKNEPIWPWIQHYLVISKLKESDRGFYVCAAENSVGRNTTEKVYLRVNSKYLQPTKGGYIYLPLLSDTFYSQGHFTINFAIFDENKFKSAKRSFA